MNPHFLFNALNSIRALIEEDRDKARFKLLDGTPSAASPGRPLRLDDPLIVLAGTHYRAVRVRQIVCLRAGPHATLPRRSPPPAVRRF